MYHKYLTTGSFDAETMKDVLSFHDLTKVQRFSSAKYIMRNSQYSKSERGVAEISAARKVYINGDVEALPPVTSAFKGDFDRIKLRSSCRSFDPAELECREEIRNTLLLCCETRVGVSGFDMTTRVGLRAYPSPGGTYPVEIYLFERAFKEGEPFKWTLSHLDPRNKELRLLRTFDSFEELDAVFIDGDNLDLLHRAEGAVVTSCVFDRVVAKYGHQGYKFGLMELGFVSQHIGNALTIQNVDTLNWAGTLDNELAGLMGLDIKTEVLGHTLWYGKKRPETDQ